MTFLLLTLTQLALAEPPEHLLFSELLHSYVHDGEVNYTDLQKNDADKLRAYERLLKKHPPTPQWTEADRLAYWINAYNAFTLQLILDNTGVKSIRDVGWPWSPWSKKFIGLSALGQKKISLDDIEHQIIRARFNEPRIHFALVCASKSYPPLRSEAYTAAKLEQQLSDQARVFLTDPRKNDAGPDGLHLSPIFKWYGEDFTKDGRSLHDYVRPYLTSPVSPNAPISWTPYDWSLNGH